MENGNTTPLADVEIVTMAVASGKARREQAKSTEEIERKKNIRRLLEASQPECRNQRINGIEGGSCSDATRSLGRLF